MTRKEWFKKRRELASRPVSLGQLDKAALVAVNVELMDLIRAAGELLESMEPT
jgi:hypothetical protein